MSSVNLRHTYQFVILIYMSPGGEFFSQLEIYIICVHFIIIMEKLLVVSFISYHTLNVLLTVHPNGWICFKIESKY